METGHYLTYGWIGAHRPLLTFNAELLVHVHRRDSEFHRFSVRTACDPRV